MKNSKKAFLLVSIFALTLMYIGYSYGERQGLLFSFLLVVASLAVFYYYADIRILNLFPVQAVGGQDPWNLIAIVEDLCRKARIPSPKIYICKLAPPTAITIGNSWHKSAILVTEALLHKFKNEELQAVLALEIAKIQRLDTMIFGVLSLIISIMLSLTQTLDQILCFNWLHKKNFFPITHFFMPLSQFLFRFAVGFQNYYDADKYASQLIGNPQLVAQTLWKLHSYATTEPLMIPFDTAHLFIVNPLPQKSWWRNLQIQPRFEDRIRKLVGHFPI